MRLAPRIVVLLLASLLLSGPSLARAPAATRAQGPDAHDRALVAELVGAYASAGSAAQQRLRGFGNATIMKKLSSCPGSKSKLKKDPLAVVFGLLPAMLIDVIHQVTPELSAYERRLSGLRPDSPVFKSWLTLSQQQMQALLALGRASSGVDYCKAATALLDKSQSGYLAALGLSPDEASKLRALNQGTGSAAKKVRSSFRAFLLGDGLKPKLATAIAGG